MQKLTLKLQVWLGFSLMLFLTAIVAFSSIFFLSSVNKNANHIATKAQPVMVDALIITSNLNDTARNINAYIITQQNSDRERLAKSIDILGDHLKRFSEHEYILEHDNLSANVAEVQSLIDDFNEYIIEIENLIDNPADNYPALALSASKVNPLNQSILSSLNQSITSELEEGNTHQRKQLLIELSDIRHNWMNIVASNRAFLANPSEEREKKTQTYRKNHELL